MSWILLACFTSSLGLCQPILEFPYATQQQCLEGKALIVQNPKIKWAVCKPPPRKEV